MATTKSQRKTKTSAKLNAKIVPGTQKPGPSHHETDEDAAEETLQLDNLIDQAPGLLDEIYDLIQYVRLLAFGKIPVGKNEFLQQIDEKALQMAESLKSEHRDNHIMRMSADLLAATYFDVVYWSLARRGRKKRESPTAEIYFCEHTSRTFDSFSSAQRLYKKLSQQKQKGKLGN